MSSTEFFEGGASNYEGGGGGGNPIRIRETLTRAQKRLILTNAYRRQPPGMPESYPEASRFLGEIQEHLLERFRVPAAVA